MLDHGDLEGHFYLDNGDGEKITPQELNLWLMNLENELNPQALSQPRVIIISSCYSGHFLPVLSQPNSNRVIITSTAAQEESYKGPQEPDGIRSGEYFLEALFDFFGQGYSLTTAFELATQRTEQFTRADDQYVLNEQFQDYAVQHPLLDDNGDQQGSNQPGTEGQLAKSIYLGLGERLSDAIFKIENVTPTTYLAAHETSAQLWARVTQPHRVKDQQMIVSIREPNQQLITDGTEQREPLEIELDQTNLSAAASSNEFNTHFDGFTQAGRYDLFYSVIDNKTGTRLERHSVVYKQVANNQPPTAVKLLQPAINSDQPTTLIFDWEPSHDPEGEAVTYTFLLAMDSSFKPLLYQQEGLRLTMATIDDETRINDRLNQGRTGLRDDTNYVWKVQAIDKYGEMTESPVWTFHTNNTNFPPSLGSLYVYNAVNFTSLENAALDFWLVDENGLPIFDPVPEVVQEQGYYNFMLPMGRRHITLKVDGYQDQEVLIDTSADLAEQQIAMIPKNPLPPSPGQLQFAVAQTQLDEAQGEVAILVERVDGDDGAVAVAYQVLPESSATRREDYSLEASQLTWADQESSPQKVLITLHDDQQAEGEETLRLQLHDPSGGATLGEPNRLTITLKDDDQLTAGQLRFAAEHLTVEETQGEVALFVERVDGEKGSVAVAYQILPTSSATRGEDYSLAEGQLIWADQESSPQQWLMTLHLDDEVEGEETVQLQLMEPSGGATLGESQRLTVTIKDNLLPPNPLEAAAGIVAFMQQTYRLEEDIGWVSTFTVTRTGGNQGAITVPYTTLVNGTTAQLGLDYEGGVGLLSWADGKNTPQAIELRIIDDSQPEDSETIQLQLEEPTGGARLGIYHQATLIIVDDDPKKPDDPQPSKAQLEFSSPLYWVQEEDQTAQMTVTRTGSSQEAVTVQYIATVNSSATLGADYDNGVGTLSWVDGETQSQPITLEIYNDDLIEGDEIIHFMLAQPTGAAALGNRSETVVVIRDNSPPVPIPSPTTVQLTSAFEQVKEQDHEILISILRTGAQGEATVDYETFDGSATANEDYLPRQGRLVWADGEEGLVSTTIPILADHRNEMEEHFTLRLFNPSEGVQLGKLSQVEIRIQDQGGSPNDSSPIMLPHLGRGMVLVDNNSTLKKNLPCQTLPCPVKAAFYGGSSVNGLSYRNPLTLHPYQYVTLQGEIDVVAEHAGQLADLLIVATWQPLHSNEPPIYLMLDNQGQILPWNLNLASLVAAQPQVKLAPTQEINLYTGFLSLGQIQWFFGYRLLDGVIVFNGEQAIELVIRE
jgi:hypothetical protein